jgi:anti-sigma factor RsiW
LHDLKKNRKTMSKATPIVDEELVAYLDGVIDPARRKEIVAALAHDELLAARLTKLDIDTEAIRAAFGAKRLAANPTTRPWRAFPDMGVSFKVANTSMRWPRFVAVLALGAGLGFALGSGSILPSSTTSKNWRTAVADYQVLYSNATLAALNSDAARQRTEVAAVAQKLRLPIALDTVQVAGLDFKRAQLLQFNGKPLAQFAYLTGAGTPIAFCVTRSGETDSPVQTTTLDGLGAAFWSKDGYGFIVIGAAPMQVAERMASELAGRM